MLTLRSGTNVIVVAPEHGAGVIGWMKGGTPLLRRAVPSAVVAGNPHTMGWFPLVPYCNRIGQGRFNWLGRDYHLAPNFGDNPHTIHGIGWQRAWTIDAVTDDHVTLGMHHDADPLWPFAFWAQIIYRVLPGSVIVTITVTNRHDTPAPAGIGLHPYFPKANEASLRFAAAGVWVNGPDLLPYQHGAIHPDWDHRTARLAAAERLDNCFTGWDGKADISAGPASLGIEASGAFGNLQVFTPDWGDFFCAEPVTHIPDAINRPDLPAGQGMTALPTGGTLRGTIRLTLAPPL
jgi:aldose 1-epimerase